MDILDTDGFSLHDLSEINVILGKNGCGKSYLLKRIESGTRNREEYGRVRYISPERGGDLVYEPGIEQAIAQNITWLDDQRRRNQSTNFRQTSATLFRRLELLVLRHMERNRENPEYVHASFDRTIEKLNMLLDRVRLERDDAKGFRILDKNSNAEVQPSEISSGEAELISLGIEFLAFVRDCVPSKKNLLLVDEPDVHLHPDLQDRLARFIVDVLNDHEVTLILATHSTALLAGLAESEDARVAFMRRGNTILTFRKVSDVDRAILPIFGAHPLSNVFNQAPALLVEGEDDERIWQQAVRSSGGKIRVFPCVVDSIVRLAEFETEVNNVIESVYDDARAFSVRDRDFDPEAIDDVGHVVRSRLSCRAAENLMLSDDVLQSVKLDWPHMKELVEAWVAANANHQYHAQMQTFAADGFDRRGSNLKDIRNILVGLMSNKPWEVLVGQSIASLVVGNGVAGDDSLRAYLGDKICTTILGIA